MREYLANLARTLSPIVIIALVAAPLPLIAASASASDSVEAPAHTTLTIGRVSGNPRKHAGRLTAFGEYLLERLDGHGLLRAEIVLNSNPQKILAAAAAGDIDLISETVFTAARLENTGAMEIALLEWKRDVDRYRTAVLVRKESDIRSLKDLRGRTFAFEDRGSTSGFFLPYLEIMDAGLTMVPMGQRNLTPGVVRYSFAESEINVVASVIRGRTDAGAISETDLDDP